MARRFTWGRDRRRLYETKVDVDRVIELYQEGQPMTAIATMLGVGVTTVGTYVKEAGISRSKSEAKKLAFQMGRESHFGDKHPGWKGGRRKAAGYIFIYSPGHPRANPNRPYVQEHILVLEKKLGRPLTPDEVGHHINGVKDDNRPDNLVAMKKGKHHSKLLLLTLQQRIRELETNLVKAR